MTSSWWILTRNVANETQSWHRFHKVLCRQNWQSMLYNYSTTTITRFCRLHNSRISYYHISGILNHITRGTCWQNFPSRKTKTSLSWVITETQWYLKLSYSLLPRVMIWPNQPLDSNGIGSLDCYCRKRGNIFGGVEYVYTLYHPISFCTGPNLLTWFN